VGRSKGEVAACARLGSVLRDFDDLFPPPAGRHLAWAILVGSPPPAWAPISPSDRTPPIAWTAAQRREYVRAITAAERGPGFLHGGPSIFEIPVPPLGGVGQKSSRRGRHDERAGRILTLIRGREAPRTYEEIVNRIRVDNGWPAARARAELRRLVGQCAVHLPPQEDHDAWVRIRRAQPLTPAEVRGEGDDRKLLESMSHGG
jgi:hypothetical protein